MNTKIIFFIVAATSMSPALAAGAPTLQLTADIVNDAGLIARVGPHSRGAAVLRAQILLDRAHFSPGEIDAVFGSNTRKALAAFQKSTGLRSSARLDEPTWAALNRDTAPVLMQYVITDADVAGPYAPVPDDMLEKSGMPALGYESVQEELGEKFHASPQLLQRLNPGKDLAHAGEEIVAPNIESAALPKAAKIIVDQSDSTVSLLAASGKTLAQFPATIGSQHDPLPIGRWKIKGVARNPVFRYNPKLFWDANPKHTKATLPPGPNNPVGVVWVDLSIEHYGMHGTPEPSRIGKTHSHGCIRLTNWDAEALSRAVSPGTPAILQQ